MDIRKEQDAASEAPANPDKHELSTPPDFSAPQKPITDFVGRPDFPEGIVGEHVMIGGYAGVVVAIVKNSIKVRSAEGFTRSFNVFGLRRIYGPPPELEPLPPSAASNPPPRPMTAAPKEPPQAAPPREVVTEPDYTQPVVPIVDLISRADFPKCTFGRYVDIGGYDGVVVEIANQSLKVRSPQGTSRSYNVFGLRNIYGKR